MWRMAMGTRQSEQGSLWVATAELPKSPGHPFYTRLNALLEAGGFDRLSKAITNAKTRRAYKADVEEFIGFTGLRGFAALRTITRAHVIAWRKNLEKRALAPSSIRRKLSALSALFDYLCEHNALAGNPVDGVKRPVANGNEGSTPALGDAQVRKLLNAPSEDTLKGVRDRAILATLLYHGIRREELCRLRVRDIQSRQGVLHFRVKGKRDKVRFVPVHVA